MSADRPIENEADFVQRYKAGELEIFKLENSEA
jgi:hypothetical protein